MAIDPATRADLEVFQGFGDKNIFQMLDSTVTSYGQAFLWDLLANPLTDVREIRDRQAAVQFLVADPELRFNIQSTLTEFNRRDFPYRNRSGDFYSRLEAIEDLIIDGEIRSDLFKYGKTTLSAFSLGLLKHAVGLVLPVATWHLTSFDKRAYPIVPEIISALPDDFSHFLSLKSMLEMTWGANLLFSPFYFLTYCWYQLGKYHDAIIQAKVVLTETNRLFQSGNKFQKLLDQVAPVKLQSISQAIGETSSTASPFIDKLASHVALDYKRHLAKSWWFRVIPLYHEFVAGRDRYLPATQSMLHTLGDLDALCSQADAAEKYGFGFAEIVDRAAPLFIAEGLRHPFLDKPIFNDVTLDDTNLMVLHGLNGSGKSILMKAICLAAQMIQTGGGGPFTQATLTPFAHLMTSININDKITEGKSSFYAVIDQLLMILNTANDGDKLLAGLDQIVEGETDHLEAVASAKAIAEYLAGLPNVKIILATHLEELANWVDQGALDRAQTYHLQTEIGGNGEIDYSRLLKPHCSTLRAAIQILKNKGFPPEVVAAAERFLAELIADPTQV